MQTIPTELLLEISDHLPMHSFIALCLTCKDLYHNETLRRLWTRVLPQCQQEYIENHDALYWGGRILNHQVYRLLHLLERDLPDRSFCRLCQKLHRRCDPPKFMTREECELWEPCPLKPSQTTWLHCDRWGLHLNFEIFESAYHREKRIGGDFAKLLRSISFASSCWRLFHYHDETLQMKLELRPVSVGETLIIHTCQRVKFNSRYHGHQTKADKIPSFLRPCQCFNDQSPFWPVWQLLRPDRTNTKAPKEISGMWRCRNCRVDCSISICESQERKLELRIETWQNMGSVHRFSCQCTREPLRFQPSSPLCRECDDSKNTMRHCKSQAATQSTPRHYLTLIRMEDLVDGDLSRLLPASFDESGNFLRPSFPLFVASSAPSYLGMVATALGRAGTYVSSLLN